MKRTLRTELAKAMSDEHYVVSVIVPCYNAEKYLSRCLDSLAAQTLDGVEVICVNDGSSDNSMEILKRYQMKYPTTIVIVDKDNEGAWRGRRDGVATARGDYIGFVDSDDYVELDFCENLYRCVKDNDASIAVCGFHREDVDTGKILTTEMSQPKEAFVVSQQPERLIELNGAPWNKIFKAELLKTLPDLIEPPKIFEDIMMLLLSYLQTDKVAFCPKPLVHYVVHEGSIMTTINSGQIEPTYRSMEEIREIYREKAPDYLNEFLDLAAFLHLGISLMFRISCDPDANIKDVLVGNEAFLDCNFAGWRSTNMVSLRKAKQHGGVFPKLYLAKLIYKAHLMPIFLVCYKGLISKGIDIKW